LVEEGKAGRPEPSAGGPEAAEPAADPPARPGEVEDPSLTALVPGTAEEKDKGKGKDKDKGKGKGKEGGKGKTGQVTWEFRHKDHWSPFQGNCQKFIEERYQAYKYAGGRDHIDRVMAGKVTFKLRFSEPMQSQVTSIEGKSVDRPWADVRRSVW